MPYVVKKSGERWCVYKEGEDGELEGETLGCHDSEAEAKAQQAALYANEPGDTEDAQKRSLIDRLKTWLGIGDAPAPAAQRAIAYSQIYEQVWNQVQAAMGEGSYATLLDIYDDAGQTYAVLAASGKLYRTSVMVDGATVRLGIMQEVEAQFAPVRSGRLAITRDGQGGTRWFAIAGSAVLNRDGEIDSKALFDSFVQHAEQTGEYPELRFFHKAALRMGVADYVARDGNVYIASGILDADNTLAVAFEQALAEGRGAWGCSIGFNAGEYEMHEIAPDVRVPVYRRGVNREISVLPEDLAASWYTTVLEVTRMESRVKQALGVLFGDPAKAETFIATVDEANDEIEQRGLVTRETPTAESAPVIEATPDPEPAVAIVEPVMAQAVGAAPEPGPSITDTLQAALTSLQTTVDGLMARLTAIEGTSAETVAMAQSVKDVTQRLATVETVVGQWQQERALDMPRATGTTATYRPSVAHAKGAPQTIDTEAVAQATLAKMKPQGR